MEISTMEAPIAVLDDAAGALPTSTDVLLQTLQQWSEAGWLRRLDAAFAGLVVTLCPKAPSEVVLAAALLAHLEGQGHSCLRIADLLGDAAALLGWSDEAAEALAEAMQALPRSAGAWLAALADCEAVYVEGTAADRNQPLVLAQQRLYLRRYWRYEQTVLRQVRERLVEPVEVDRAAAQHWLARLFPPTATAGPDWQKVACAIALRGRLTIVTGGPGTGKTYTAARLLALFAALESQTAGLRIALAAPTGKAAARLKQSIDAALGTLLPELADVPALQDLSARIGPARTLHSLLGTRPDSRRFRHGAAHPVDVDLVIVDEASMVHLEMMAALLEALPRRARIILLGDKDQLASVEAGSVLGDLCEGAGAAAYDEATRDYLAEVMDAQLPPGPAQNPSTLAQHTVVLRESRRFAGPMGRLAQAVNAGDAVRASDLLHSDRVAELSWLAPSTGRAGAPGRAVARLALAEPASGAGGYRVYCELLRQRPPTDVAAHADWVRRTLTAFEGFRVLCAVRDGEWGVDAMNGAIETALVQKGLLHRTGEWYDGRPVMVTRNDAAIGVYNGDVGLALRAAQRGGPLRVYFADGAKTRSVPVGRLANAESAFAMTVHKSQGSEFEHTVLVLPEGNHRVLTRELVYTGVTRAKSRLTLVSTGSEALDASLSRKMTRASGLVSTCPACDWQT